MAITYQQVANLSPYFLCEYMQYLKQALTIFIQSFFILQYSSLIDKTLGLGRNFLQKNNNVKI